MKHYYISLFLCCIIFSNAQINKLDAKGKKHGKWKCYLDKYWNVLEDSTNATYYNYTFYEAGVSSHAMGLGGKNKLWKMRTTVDTSAQKGIKILNGDYRWHDYKGRLMYWHIFQDGVYVSYKEYYETGELYKFFDYTKHAEGKPWSWYLIEYNKDGSIKNEGFAKKDANGNWLPMK
jgi:hypothetical protein